MTQTTDERVRSQLIHTREQGVCGSKLIYLFFCSLPPFLNSFKSPLKLKYQLWCHNLLLEDRDLSFTSWFALQTLPIIMSSGYWMSLQIQVIRASSAGRWALYIWRGFGADSLWKETVASLMYDSGQSSGHVLFPTNNLTCHIRTITCPIAQCLTGAGHLG